MNTDIASDILALTTARNNIRTKLEEKGVDASGHGFADFASDIESIPSDPFLIHTFTVDSKVKEYKFSFTPTGSTYIIMVRPKTIVFQNDYSALLQVYSFNRNVGYSWLLSNTTQTIGTGTFTVSVGSGQVTVRDNYANYFPGIEYDVFYIPCA